MFKALTNIPSFHEPWPRCINIVNQNVNDHNGEIHPLVKRVLDRKIASIKRHSHQGSYLESSHMFMKAFVADVIQAFPGDVYCIYIERDIVGNVISRTKRGKMRNWGMDFFLHAHWGRNLLRMPSPLPFYATVGWNLYETRVRFEKWRPQFKETYVLDYSKINDVTEWHKLFEKFGIETKPFNQLPSGLNKNVSRGITDRLHLSMVRHVADNWNQPGTFVYKTDLQKLGIDKTPWPERNYELQEMIHEHNQKNI